VFVFSRELIPSISGFDLHEDEGFWIFEEQFSLTTGANLVLLKNKLFDLI
jgi:hypothetical protein